MPRPADDLRAQLAAEDADFVAALLDDTVLQVTWHGVSCRGLRRARTAVRRKDAN